MRRISIALLMFLASLAAFGEDLLECVNPDVQDGLLFWRPNDSRTVISSDRPDAFAAVPVPAQFQWIAGSESDPSLAGAFRTGGDPAAAMAAALDPLLADGWTLDASMVPVNAFGGDARREQRGLCRGDELMAVAAREREGTTYVTYSLRSGSMGSACTPRMPGRQMDPLQAEAPQLDLAALGGRVNGSGGSASPGRSVSSATRVTLNASLDKVTAALTSQISEQGWQSESHWTGSRMAGSSWSRMTADGKPLTGTLDIVDNGSSFTVAFRLINLGEEAVQ